jgi:hypothetical protein
MLEFIILLWTQEEYYRPTRVSDFGSLIVSRLLSSLFVDRQRPRQMIRPFHWLAGWMKSPTERHVRIQVLFGSASIERKIALDLLTCQCPCP